MNQSVDMHEDFYEGNHLPACQHSLKETTSIPFESSLSIQGINNYTQNIKCNSVQTSAVKWQELP